MAGSEGGQVIDDGVDHGEGGVEVDGVVLGPVDGEEVSVGVGGVEEAGAEAGELGIE